HGSAAGPPQRRGRRHGSTHGFWVRNCASLLDQPNFGLVRLARCTQCPPNCGQSCNSNTALPETALPETALPHPKAPPMLALPEPMVLAASESTPNTLLTAVVVICAVAVLVSIALDLR